MFEDLPNGSANQLQAHQPAPTEINASLAPTRRAPSTGRPRPAGLSAALAGWAAARSDGGNPPRGFAAPRRRRDRGSVIPARGNGAALVTTRQCSEAELPTARSVVGPQRARVRTNQRSTTCGRAHAPERKRALPDRASPRRLFNQILMKPRIAFAVGPTKMQISCKPYKARAHTIGRFHSRSIGAPRPQGTRRLCGLAAAFAG